MKINSDVIVIGAGVVGCSIAYGLARLGNKVHILDGEDATTRASRANFGLVWIQSKGYGNAHYADWSFASAKQWQTLADTLLEETGINVHLTQPGGYCFCVEESDLEAQVKKLNWLKEHTADPDYDFKTLPVGDLKKVLPFVGDSIAGATYSPMDGHVNPLLLYRALREGLYRHHGKLFPSEKAVRVYKNATHYVVETAKNTFYADKVVITAGYAAQHLGASIGVHIPVRPLKGEVLITARTEHLLDNPTNYIRQTNEGTIQIGDSHEDIGMDTRVEPDIMSDIAYRAVRCIPILAKLPVVRCWAGLRIMTPDGLPIYEQSPSADAFGIACHSGVTLAARHVLSVAPAIADNSFYELTHKFSSQRFLKGM